MTATATKSVTTTTKAATSGNKKNDHHASTTNTTTTLPWLLSKDNNTDALFANLSAIFDYDMRYG